MKAAIIFLAACGHQLDDGMPCSNGTAHLQIVRVDENSTYMKSVYAHVGSDRNNKPSDPDAIAAGISAEVDLWNDEETKAGMELPGKRHTDYYLVGHDRVALEKYLAALPPMPSDRKLVLEHDLLFPESKDRREYWRTYYVDPSAIIDETEIASATTVEPDGERVFRPSLRVKLTPRGQAAFAVGTAKNIGHKLATVVDGTVLSAPIIMNEINGGRLMLTTESTAAAADLLKRLGCS